MADRLSKLWLDREGTALVVVDVQDRLTPSMEPHILNKVIRSIRTLMEGVTVLGLPVITTEQYPRGLGRTIPELAPAQGEEVIEKTTFSCCGETGFLTALSRKEVRRVILTGMEAHVCVFQTLLDLLHHGYQVHLVRDAVCSRSKEDYLTALHNAAQAGATITTVEIALFQMLRDSKAPEFKTVSNLIKNR
jgi:nicotinamidase-related amidase